MVVDLALYTLVHQPRRLKLPAQPVPRYASIEDITRCLFDERLNEYFFRQVARSSYEPGARVFLDLVRQQGLRLALGISLAFVRQAERWDPALLDLFRELIAEEGVELVAVDPYQSLHWLLDLPAYAERMNWTAGELARLFGKRPVIADSTDMCQSASIYNALDAAGFRGALFDGDPRILQWRSSAYLYTYSDEQPHLLESKPQARARRVPRGNSGAATSPAGEPHNLKGLFLLARHQDLSADINQRFSQHAWAGYPLYAETYARWIAQAEGDFVLLNWDFASLGGRHHSSTGIFEFIQALPAELVRQEVTLRTPGEIIERCATERAYHLPLPVHPPAWSEQFGLENGASHGPWNEFLQRVRDIYNLARLTENPELYELALWLAQSEHFRPEPRLAAPFIFSQGQNFESLVREQRRLYCNALAALEPYLPVRRARQGSGEAVTESAEKPAKPRATGRRKTSAQKSEPAEEKSEEKTQAEEKPKAARARSASKPRSTRTRTRAAAEGEAPAVSE